MKKALIDFDWILTIISFLILTFGLSGLASIDSSFLPQQLISFSLGLILFIFFSLIDYRVFLKLSWLLYFGCLIFLGTPLLFGTITRGAFRWIQIGKFTLQPSELTKPFLILFLAGFFSRFQKLDFKKISQVAFLILLPVGLVLFQPDLGSSLVLVFSFLGIILATGLAWRWLLAGGLSLLAILPLGWRLLQGYQKQRILSFLNPEQDPLGSSYNLIQAKVAVGSGRLWGRGWGQGTQSQLHFLPERHTDFIFASLAEEFGFLGSAILFILLVFLLWRILFTSRRSKNYFGFLTSLGIFTLLFSQIFINIAINLGLLPVTGLPLPLISYGGSSLLATMISLGIINNISRQTKHHPNIEIK